MQKNTLTDRDVAPGETGGHDRTLTYFDQLRDDLLQATDRNDTRGLELVFERARSAHYATGDPHYGAIADAALDAVRVVRRTTPP